jgi:hypothetical protein
MMEKLLFLFFIVLVSFLTNIAWENFHSRFYNTEGTARSRSRIPICPIMDGIIILLLYLLLALIFGEFYWIERADFASIAIVVIIGGGVAIIIEKVSLWLGLWTYNERMPRVPLANAGLWPVLQLMILPSISYFISYFLVEMLQ